MSTMLPERLFIADGREVRPFVATNENIAKILDFIHRFPLAADQVVSDDSLLEFLLSPRNVAVESGDLMVMLENVIPERMADVHFIFLDRKVLEHEEFLRETLQELAKMFNLERLSAQVPSRNRTMCRMLERLGFSHEGTMRDAFVSRDGVKCDMVIYGLLRSDYPCQ